MGFTNRNFEVEKVLDDTEMIVKWVENGTRVRMDTAFHTPSKGMTGRVESGAAQQIHGVSQEVAALSRVFRPIQMMLHWELKDRIQRSKSWEEKMKTNKTVAKYRDLKDDCDTNEVETLPKNFSDLWGVIVDSRKHRDSFVNVAKYVPKLAEWKSLTYDYPVAKVLNPGFSEADREDFLMLYKICDGLYPKFKKHMDKVEKELKKLTSSGFELKVADLKKKPRAIYKFIYKYGYDVRRLTDIMRASIIFDDLDSIRQAAEVIHKHFGGIRNIKDRIASPIDSGYRDVLINVQYGDVMVEIQLHLRAFYKLKSSMHKTYKKARHFGAMFNQLCYHK